MDPYYLTHKAEKLGYHPDVILSGRRVNDNMARFVSERIIKALIKQGHSIKGQNVNVYGLTFKENCPDLRNTKVIHIVEELKDYGMNVSVADSCAHPDEALEEYGIELIPLDKLPKASVSVMAVAHREYFDLGFEDLGSDIVFDLKNIFKGLDDSRLHRL